MTLLATKDSTAPTCDDRRLDVGSVGAALLFTTENAGRRRLRGDPGLPVDRDGHLRLLGRGGYEGIQNDSAATSGSPRTSAARRPTGTNAKQPNSFIYRFVPATPTDLAGGKLQALQVHRPRDGHPITSTLAGAPSDIAAELDRACTPTATTSRRSWVTIHNTAIDGTAPFNANALAKAANAHAVQAARERRRSGRTASSRSSTSTRPATPNAASTENAAAAAGAPSSS